MIKNPAVDVLTWAQTRNGLQKIRHRWADMMEDSLWASWPDLIKQIEENNLIRVPIFSLRYTWISEGKCKFLTSLSSKLNKSKWNSHLLLKTSLPYYLELGFQSDTEFDHGTPFTMDQIKFRIKRFTPDGMYTMLMESANEPNAASMHELFYLGHNDRCLTEPLNPLVKWMVEKSLERDVLGNKQIEQG